MSIGLFGLILGYVLVLGRTGGLVSANSYFCPAKKEICTGGGCNTHPSCASGVCNVNCPGNCNNAA